MAKIFFMIGSITTGIGVTLGAFGAHGLKKLVSPEMLDTWDKAVRYQIYHGLALLVVAWALTQWPSQVRALGKLESVRGMVFFDDTDIIYYELPGLKSLVEEFNSVDLFDLPLYVNHECLMIRNLVNHRLEVAV